MGPPPPPQNAHHTAYLPVPGAWRMGSCQGRNVSPSHVLCQAVFFLSSPRSRCLRPPPSRALCPSFRSTSALVSRIIHPVHTHPGPPHAPTHPHSWVVRGCAPGRRVRAFEHALKKISPGGLLQTPLLFYGNVSFSAPQVILHKLP